ncbi:MAG: TonB-dependent receptor plug domain-containing protein [Saprospiraceae bacterium]
MNQIFYCLFALSILFVTQDLEAQEIVDTSYVLSELAVTANRNEKPLFYCPESIGILDKKSMLSNQYRSSPEALAAMPGLFVQKTNHGGGSPFVRGLTGNQTLLLIDGIRLNNATFRYGPNQYFNTIDLFSLDKIEVLSGGGSIQYGSDALGGTIQAFTKSLSFSEKPDFGGLLLLRGATQEMEQTAHTEIEFSTRKASFGAGFSWRNFGDLVGGDTTGRQMPSGYSELDFDAKGKIALFPKTVLTLAHQQVHQTNAPVFHKIQLENFAINQFNPQNRSLSYARLEQSVNQGVWKSVSFTGSIQQTEEGRESKKNGSKLLIAEKDQVRTAGIQFQINNAFLKKWTASTGVEYYHDLVQSSRIDLDQTTGVTTSKRGLYPDGSTMANFAVFSLHALDLPAWNFTAGLRWNRFVVKVKDETIGLAKLNPSALVGNSAILYKLNPYSNLFGSVNTSFRAPNIDDLGTLGIVDFRYETPNYSLEPERAINLQIGYRLKTKRLQGTICVYRNTLRNLISRIKVDTQMVQGYPLYQKDNTDRALVQGFETYWTYAFARYWLARGTVTYTYGQNLTLKEPLRRIPPIFGQVALQYTKRSWSGSIESIAAGKQDRLAKGDIADNRIPKGGTPAWLLLNVHIGYSWRFVQLRASAFNVFNIDYRTHGSGVNGYGRSVFATLIFQWDKRN